jgi:hypothetical protein
MISCWGVIGTGNKSINKEISMVTTSEMVSYKARQGCPCIVRGVANMQARDDAIADVVKPT